MDAILQNPKRWRSRYICTVCTSRYICTVCTSRSLQCADSVPLSPWLRDCAVILQIVKYTSMGAECIPMTHSSFYSLKFLHHPNNAIESAGDAEKVNAAEIAKALMQGSTHQRYLGKGSCPASDHGFDCAHSHARTSAHGALPLLHWVYTYISCFLTFCQAYPYIGGVRS